MRHLDSVLDKLVDWFADAKYVLPCPANPRPNATRLLTLLAFASFFLAFIVILMGAGGLLQ
jgi:hypothetical protein